jgi:hypothetical protein
VLLERLTIQAIHEFTLRFGDDQLPPHSSLDERPRCAPWPKARNLNLLADAPERSFECSVEFFRIRRDIQAHRALRQVFDSDLHELPSLSGQTMIEPRLISLHPILARIGRELLDADILRPPALPRAGVHS